MSIIHDPVTGEAITEVADTDPTSLDRMLDEARAAFPAWRRVPATERGALLRRCAGLMREHAEELAELEARNTGKPITHTRGEVERAALAFEYYGGWADKHVGATIPVPGEYHTYTVPEPHGVVAGVIPWNVPYVFAALKVAPALAFGNAIVLKPAPETPLSALRLAELVAEAGVPRGLVHVAVGGGEIGERLVGDPRVDLVVFTGSHETGRAVARTAAERLTPVALELGGKNPQLVFADADIDAAVDGIMLGAYSQCGQMCIAGTRILVEERVYRDVVERVRERVRALRVGDPREEGVNVGPQTTAAQRDKTMSMIESAQAEGVEVLAQAPVPDAPELAGGYFATPTAFVDAPVDSQIMQEEVFGPVLGLRSFRDEAEAVELANATSFGLAAGVWTGDVGRAHRVASEVDAGTVWINTYRVLSVLVPFGGFKLSGFGREGGQEAARLYTRIKSVWTSLDGGLPPGYRL